MNSTTFDRVLLFLLFYFVFNKKRSIGAASREETWEKKNRISYKMALDAHGAAAAAAGRTNERTPTCNGNCHDQKVEAQHQVSLFSCSRRI